MNYFMKYILWGLGSGPNPHEFFFIEKIIYVIIINNINKSTKHLRNK